MLKRERNLNQIQPFIDKPVVKVITGIRRCGKSTFLKFLMDYLNESGVPEKNILFVNKDSLDFEFIKTYQDLYIYFNTTFRNIKGKKYVFIDEVQEIQEWERAVSDFYTGNKADIYITGSNAKLLSSELATLLTGRYVEIKMNTLVFSEFLKIRNKSKSKKEEEFALFLKYGGFPGIHHMEMNDEVVGQYLQSLYSTILLKDVVARNQVRDVHMLERIARFVADNCGNITSAKGINDYIKSQGLKTSVDTIQNYLLWLSDAYFSYKVNRYDVKGKRQLEIYEKYFLGDTGMAFSILGNRVQDISGRLENIVYLELLSRGFNVFIGKLYNQEIDFLAVKGNRKLYIQVTYMLTDKKVIEREFSVLDSVKDNYTKIVLSLDKYFGNEREGIKWYNLIDFLLMEEIE